MVKVRALARCAGSVGGNRFVSYLANAAVVFSSGGLPGLFDII